MNSREACGHRASRPDAGQGDAYNDPAARVSAPCPRSGAAPVVREAPSRTPRVLMPSRCGLGLPFGGGVTPRRYSPPARRACPGRSLTVAVRKLSLATCPKGICVHLCNLWMNVPLRPSVPGLRSMFPLNLRLFPPISARPRQTSALRGRRALRGEYLPVLHPVLRHACHGSLTTQDLPPGLDVCHCS